MADTSKRPTHDVYFVKDRGKDQKGYWTTIGAAWAHEDQMGMSLALDFIPTDLKAGRIQVRVRTEKTKPEEAQQ